MFAILADTIGSNSFVITAYDGDGKENALAIEVSKRMNSIMSIVHQTLKQLRLWCIDRHERRKDKAYRERLEEQRLQLDCQLIQQRVLRESIGNLKRLGATPTELVAIRSRLLAEQIRKSVSKCG